MASIAIKTPNYGERSLDNGERKYDQTLYK